MKDTAIPGLVLKDHGRGKVAWLPWDLGQLYYQALRRLRTPG